MAIRDQINNVVSLDQLCEILNDYDPAENGNLGLGELVDMTDLPTFGGLSSDDFEDAVVPTSYPVWSWDDSRAIVDGDGTIPFQIVTHDHLRD